MFDSHAGQQAKSRKLRPERLRVIHNLIDTQKFYPRPESVGALRNELGLEARTQLVGIVGNLSDYKDYPNFLHAAELVHETLPDVHFVVVGNHSSPTGLAVMAMTKAMQLDAHIHFLGSRSDVQNILRAFDVFLFVIPY